MINIEKDKVKVLVVDDSAFMRKVLKDIINSDEDTMVLDTAKNGLEAIEKASKSQPDVITLDIKMPVMDGLECLKELKKICNIPVIMLSSITKEGAEATIEALADGAIDFITKPINIFEMTGEEKKKEILSKIKLVAGSKRNIEFTKCNINNKEYKVDIKYYVAIGTSTGGPKALQYVIPLIPENVPAAFLVVQHMPPGFTKSLAERLHSMSKVVVKEAENGETVKPGHVYIAPGDYHMLVEKQGEGVLKIKLTKDPPCGGHRPAVDIMMESVSHTGFNNIIGVIMTGMGRDGSAGIEKLKQFNNAHIIAEDESSCVVFGMPKSAIQTGKVDVVVPVNEIIVEIMKKVGGQK